MNNSLNNAKVAKNDEFYTLYEDVVKELQNYDFKGKVVYCPCDGESSQFVKYFMTNFTKLGLKMLFCTSFSFEGHGTMIAYDGMVGTKHDMQGNGDFRSEECSHFFKDCDVVVTNPPFSLFREFVATLKKYGKDFLIVGTENAVVFKDFFKDIKENNVHIGENMIKTFLLPNGEYQHFGNICWWTNLTSNGNGMPMPRYKKPHRKPLKYDNYDAVDICRVENIPRSYKGVLGVPITFLKYQRNSGYEVVGVTSSTKENASHVFVGSGTTAPLVGGKKKFARLLIRKVG